MKRLLTIALAMLLLFALLVGCAGNADKNTGANSTNTPTSQPESTPDPTPDPTPTPEPTPDPNKEIEIEFAAWSGVFTEDGWNHLFDSFAKYYPNIKIKREISADVNDILAARVVTGDMPDIVWGGMPNGYELLKAGKVYDFTDFFQSKAFDFDGTVEESLSTGMADAETFKGGRFLVPNNPGFYGVVYNEKMFEDNGWSVPRNWEELIAIAPKIKAAGINPLAYGTTGEASYVEGVVIPSLVNAVGGQKLEFAIDNLDEGAWNSPEMVKVFTMLKEMVDAGVIDTKGLGMEPFQGQLAFCKGEYAMCISGFWFSGEMADYMGDLKVGFMPFPANFGGNKQQILNSWVGGAVAWETSDPDKRFAIEAFMRYLCSYEFQNWLVKDAGWALVSNRRVMEEISTGADTPYFTKQVAATVADPNVKMIYQKYQMWEVDGIRLPLIGLVGELIQGNMTPQQVADKMETNARNRINNDPTEKRYR